ncbi:ABC transporter permease, partial [Acidobacteria bacterium AH-259-A15]|nr:ABC transporter permease [Acidobacteria bacterium AH-259-A15]
MGNLLPDLRYAIRTLGKSPGFTAAVVLTLALGIGANTAIFSVVNAVLLRPLPFQDPDQLVFVYETTRDGSYGGLSYPNLRDWQEQNSLFAAISAWPGQSVNLTGTGEPERVRGRFVSASFSKVVGVEPVMGRSFSAGEDDPGAERVVIISHGLWERRFGSEDIIGRKVMLDGDPFTVIGIMPKDFRFLGEFDVWIPVPHRPNFSPDRNTRDMSAIGRLKRGVTVEQAQAEMDVIARRLADQYPEANRDRGAKVDSLHEGLIAFAGIRPILLVLFGAVGFILLIACANVANLWLARGMARQNEIGVRAALGAGRVRLVRQLLSEAVLLCVLGGSLGWVLGSWAIDILMSLNPPDVPGGGTVDLDLRVFAFTAALSLLTGLVFGLVPALQLSKPNLNEVLKSSERTSSEDFQRSRFRGLLVIFQVAVALVLLAGAGLMIRSFWQLLEVD